MRIPRVPKLNYELAPEDGPAHDYLLEEKNLPTMRTNIKASTLVLIFVTFTTVATQTFQYSRGWTNGKRAHKRADGDLERLDEVLTPCQMNRLRAVLQGKPNNDRLLVPCDYLEEEDTPKRYKNEPQDPRFDNFL